MNADELANQVDSGRIAELALALVQIPSPSGCETEVAALYADYLRDIGLQVEFDRSYVESPSVIARLAGRGGGKTLQFDGHTDTIGAEHPAAEIKEGRVYGRGAADMKGQLASLAEALRVMATAADELPGDILVTAHGQHEDPVADYPFHAPLLALFEKGIVGDACIVAEGPAHEMVVAGRGLAFWEVEIRRQGEPLHEMASKGIPNPITAGCKLMEIFESERTKWAEVQDPYLGPEDIFVGSFQSGDYYNRMPTVCRLTGTRRYPPEKSFEAMHAEFEGWTDRIARDLNVEVGLKLIKSGQGYRVSPEQPIVKAVRRAYESQTGKSMPLIGLPSVGNASHFNLVAKVPAVYCGIGQERAHATPEYAEIAELERLARLCILSTFEYLQGRE